MAVADDKMLPADLLLCFNFFTMSLGEERRLLMEYLKLCNEVVPAYSNVMRPINLTSGCPKNQKRC
jgi:hypothetical protein